MPLGSLGIAAAITGGAGILGNITGGLLGSKSNEKAQQAAMDHWLIQQDFNSPLNQRIRLERAGLSPSLMYQTMPQNVAESTPETIKDDAWAKATPQMGNSVANMANMYMDAKLREAQINSMNADTALKQQDFAYREQNNPTLLDTNKSKLGTQNLENAKREIDLKYQDSLLSNQLTSLQQNNEKIKFEISKLEPRYRREVKEQLARTNLMLENAKLSSTQQQLNTVNSAVASWEALARSQGWSYSDNILFREVKSTLNSYINDMKSGKKQLTTSTLVKALQWVSSLIE